MASSAIRISFLFLHCVVGVAQMDMDWDRLAFEQFIVNYLREFADQLEKDRRFAIFRENLRQIDELNRQYGSTTLFGVTKFADWTEDEFRQLLLDPRYLEPVGGTQEYVPPVTGTFGQGVDYRSYLTPVKDQGNCGSCYAFSTVADVEYLYKRNTGQEFEFSEQAVIDCDSQSSGCDGGYPDTAFNLIQQRGVPLASEYRPYSASKGPCDYTDTRGTISSPYILPVGFQALQSYLVTTGPFVGTVQVPRSLQHFKGGQIFRPTAEECAANIGSHVWLVAGIGYEGNEPYYIIKNSWGTSWGEQGYIRFSAGSNACGSEVRSYCASF